MLRTAYDIADLKVGESVARSPHYQAVLAWASTPQYETVRGSAEQIRLRNYEIGQAHNKLSDYRKKYGRELGEYQLLREDREAWKLTQIPKLNSEYLAAKKKAVDRAFGGALTEAEKRGLTGAGNTVLPNAR